MVRWTNQVKTKPEIGSYDGTLPWGRDHAVVVCVVEVVRANQCEKRQKPCSHRHSGFPTWLPASMVRRTNQVTPSLKSGSTMVRYPSKGRDHAVGVCVVEVVRANQNEKRQKRCSHRHGGCPRHWCACEQKWELEVRAWN